MNKFNCNYIQAKLYESSFPIIVMILYLPLIDEYSFYDGSGFWNLLYSPLFLVCFFNKGLINYLFFIIYRLDFSCVLLNLFLTTL